jgi:dipeptidyl aminopeptidase/acylaminoacyl peptidase
MAKTYHSFGVLAAAAAAAGVLVAMGMLMLIMLVMVEPAGATFPGKNGKIAFESNRDGNYEIYSMNSNGTGLERLTNNPTDDFNAAWSPDGNKIAFTSLRDGNREIYSMNSNGKGLVVRLTNNPAEDLSPDWQSLALKK